MENENSFTLIDEKLKIEFPKDIADFIVDGFTITPHLRVIQDEPGFFIIQEMIPDSDESCSFILDMTQEEEEEEDEEEDDESDDSFEWYEEEKIIQYIESYPSKRKKKPNKPKISLEERVYRALLPTAWMNEKDIYVEREKEIKTLYEFTKSNIEFSQPGSLYICGEPGTGKTAAVNIVLDNLTTLRRKLKTEVITIEGAEFATSGEHSLFHHLWIHCREGKKRKRARIMGNNAAIAAKELTFLKEYLLSESKHAYMTVVVIDEIDLIPHERVLYTLFEWAQQKCSGLILIGISNTLALMDVLPGLARKQLEPHTLRFVAYSKKQIFNILKRRVSVQVDDEEEQYEIERDILKGKEKKVECLFADSALEFCAMSVSKGSSDIRAALDYCNRALSLALSERKKYLKSKNQERDEIKGERDEIKGKEIIDKNIYVNVRHIASVLPNCNRDVTLIVAGLPVKQKIALCVYGSLLQRGKINSMEEAFNKYKQVTKQQHVFYNYTTNPTRAYEEFCDLTKSLCSLGLLDTRSDGSLSNLRVSREDMESVSRDNRLVSTILQNIWMNQG